MSELKGLFACLKINIVVGDFINMMKMTFDFNFYSYEAVK